MSNLAINEQVFEEFDLLLGHLYQYDEGFVFRGQANAEWRLETTMERSCPSKLDLGEYASMTEKYVIDALQSRLHHYVQKDEEPRSNLGWLSLAQHHGAPTRLLDFTTIPLVALYFATRNLKAKSPNFAVWALNFRELNEDCQNVIGDGCIDTCPDAFFTICDASDSQLQSSAWIGEPRPMNLRLERQGGTFLIPTDLSRSIDTILTDVSRRCGIEVTKIIGKSSMLPQITDFLYKSGVTASRLFDGVDGLAFEVAENLQRHVNKLEAGSGSGP